MIKFILVLAILFLPYFAEAQVSNNDLRGKIGISLYGGGNIPVNGDYSSDLKTSDFLNTGSQFGVGVSYFVTKGLGVEGTLYAGYNYYSSKYRPASKDPVWVNLSASVNAIYNFGHMFKKPVVSPFVRIGAGSYQWEHFEDGIIGAKVNTEYRNHNVKSFGFNAGVGAEYRASKKFTIGLIVDYMMFFPKYENENSNLNTDKRTNYGFFSPQLKLTYYIPTR